MNANIEDSNLLWNLVNDRFIKEWQRNYSGTYQNKDTNLELQITYDCNLKCEYCYLYKNGDKLYPLHLRKRENILNNLNIFLDYIISNQPLLIDNVSLFSGEIWDQDFGYEVLEIIYQKLNKYKFANNIMIPSNCSFILNEKYKNIMQLYVDKYKSIDVKLFVSASIDGLPIESDARSFKVENKNILRDQSYYDTVFEFAVKNGFGFHPMVAACSIEKWCDNYKWWEEMSKKFNFKLENVMMLEVRNNDWTDEKIEYYLKYLELQINTLYNKFGHKEFTNLVFATKDKYRRNCNIALRHFNNVARCSVQRALFVRLGDLSINPCHRLSYDKFNFGKFVVDNDNITGIDAYNTPLACKMLLSNPVTSTYGCDSCGYSRLCILGCFGSQYENTKEMFSVCDSVCKLLKSKIDYLIKTYTELGIFECYKNMDFTYDDKNERTRMMIFDNIKDVERYNKKEQDGDIKC